jgi:hypothetical protein
LAVPGLASKPYILAYNVCQELRFDVKPYHFPRNTIYHLHNETQFLWPGKTYNFL